MMICGWQRCSTDWAVSERKQPDENFNYASGEGLFCILTLCRFVLEFLCAVEIHILYFYIWAVQILCVISYWMFFFITVCDYVSFFFCHSTSHMWLVLCVSTPISICMCFLAVFCCVNFQHNRIQLYMYFIHIIWYNVVIHLMIFT